MIDFKDEEGNSGKKGYVYVLIHPIQDGYVKIGQTKMKPEERAKQLTNQCGTGLVGKYVVAYRHPHDNPEELERIVHDRLDWCRITSCREFFHCNVETAIEIIKDTAEQLKRQTRNFDVPVIWWNSLTPTWKQVFRKNIEIIFNPGKEDLMEGVFNIISYCREEKIRELISKEITKKYFYRDIENWYAGLKNTDKSKVNSFIPIIPSENDLSEIQNLEKIDCSRNLLIENLLPIKKVKNVKVLDCSNTSITTLEPIKGLLNLEEIQFNITNINSLQPLEKSEKLRKVSCNQTALSEEEIERFKEINPKCEILTDPFKI